MVNTLTKKGRPEAEYRTSWGEKIVGLARLSDGRWKVSGNPVMKFTEPDERLAVLRFRELEAKRNGTDGMPILLGTAPVGDSDQLAAVLRKIIRPAVLSDDPVEQVNAILSSGPVVGESAKLIRLDQSGGTYQMFRDRIDEAAFWPWLRELILTSPKLVAEKTGIEQIGYLSKILKPTDSPTLKQIGELYFGKPDLSPGEVSKSKLFWKFFIKSVGVETVGDITHDNITRYETAVIKGGWQPKTVLHQYRKIRTIFAYAIKRGVGIEDCRRALDITAKLEVKESAPLDPQPISTADFWRMYDAADKAGDKHFAALMLTAMNMAGYGGEVAALKWEEIDLDTGYLVTRRPKTGVSRVAVLWPETIAALKQLDPESFKIFRSKLAPHNANTIGKAWSDYRPAAKVKDTITFGMIRDAAYTVACKISLDQARILAGHRLPGMSDNYIRRSPELVANVCTAIRGWLFAGRLATN